MKVTIKQFIKDYIGMSRYIALGSLDGILTVMSISLTAAVAGIAANGNVAPITVGITGLSGGIALALSNGFGSYIGEHAEEERTIRDLESQMLLSERELDDTIIKEDATYRVNLSMVTHGSASFLGSFIPSIPFFIMGNIYDAVISTLIICFVLLSVLGAYLGHISKESMKKTAGQIVSIGIVIVILSFLMGGGHG
ncbi:MAG: VIT1/CCC1 transporter family protein [Methanosphaera sp.]|uniref:VIT1/CCC1 transporter family protein n=1 Tax=Methanosphaera sp. TaxID=2666342 RepID=UPI0025E8DD65|nr:VIT1/CCC1 transporter family protein [Methanosphaera sp.]MCI5867880.1 VIT1/CCC1 transporter family protein [Methanosphaera sp.]MDD6534890.1 VIT1/CCC1 transporter family protein [Methanosphaera sp.]MDY3955350.1 VIT1/CCC1 transporter family protein [Methanosphaera sp.]